MILFRDAVTAYHKEKHTDADGATLERRAAAPFADRIPCQISYAGDDRGAPKGRERLPQERQIKALVWLGDIPAGQAFRRGDYVMLERRGKDGQILARNEGTIGEPRKYAHGIAHVEFSLEAGDGT